MGKHPRQTRGTRGFTMVETLVAMAILITVISGVVLVYSGAVRTVRIAYAANDNFEIGRSVHAALQRDLERAFTARQYGKYFQFHGQPLALSFVGALEDGKLGRVTYAINRLDDKNDFIMKETQNLQTVLQRAMAAITKNATGDANTRLNTAKAFTRRLALLLAQDGRISLGSLTQDQLITELPLAIDAAFLLSDSDPDGDGEWELSNVQIEDPPGSGNFIFTSAGVVDCEVRVKTAHMLRFEEPGVTDLSSFNLPPDPLNPTARLSFPLIDPESADGVKNNPTLPDYQSVCSGIFDRSVEQLLGGQELLSCLAYSSIVMPDPGGGVLDDLDLRRLMNNQSIFNVSASYINGRVVDRIFEAAKREIWLDLFTGGPVSRSLFYNGPVDPPRNYFEAWRLDDTTGLPGALQNNLNPYDYAIAERIVISGELVTFQDLSTEIPFYELLRNFDMLGVGAYFTYADEDNKYRETYNTLADIPGYTNFNDPYAINPQTDSLYLPEERFSDFDVQLGDELAGVVEVQGSPMAPRIPALVSPRFWIMSEGPSANDPPFKRYFDQVVDVPSSARRNVPKQIVPDAG